MGEAVNVGVIVAVGEAVEVAVGGRGVDDAVAVGSTKIAVPHPDNKIDNPMTKANIFFIRFLSD